MLTEALVVNSPSDPFIYTEIELNEVLQEDEVLVNIKATGVCHTDLNFRNENTIPGLFPAVLGHEGRLQSPPTHFSRTFT
jgi:aryl-alcohol dehydrogenase